MSKQFINELSRIKDLFGYRKGQVISEQNFNLSEQVVKDKCYQITNEKDKKTYKVKITDVKSNYAFADLTDEKGFSHPDREISFVDNKMETIFDVDVDESRSTTVKVSGPFKEIEC